MAADTSAARPVRHRPRTTTVFVAAFVAGAVAAVGVNRALDVRLAQARPQVECEPVFVALRALPAGAPVTVWDVALRDLPKAMVPATALRVTDSFAGRLLKFPLREGQPLISAHLAPPEVAAPATPETAEPEPAAQESIVEEAFVAPIPAPPVAAEAGDPVTDSRETVTNRPFVDEPVPSLSQQAPASGATQPGTAPEAGDHGEREPVASVADTSAIDTPAIDATAPRSQLEEMSELEETAQPADMPTPQVAAVPTPVAAASEPTPAAPSPAGAAQPGSLSSDLFGVPGAKVAADLDATLDMPSRSTASLAELPSVMASGEAAPAGPVAAGDGTRVRYLVVPERIARQVDTAFTTPAAPEAVAPVKAATQPDHGGAAARPATPAPRHQPNRATATPKQQQPRPQPAKSGARPGQPTASVPQPTGPRAWGGMFPNVAAGLEAMGSWRGAGRAAPDQTDRGSTTR
jgi:hypothetical protein